MELPRDRADLLLAPVVLDLDERLNDLGSRSAKELAELIATTSNHDVDAPGGHRAAFLATVRYLLNLRGWEVSLVERGVAVTHDRNQVVLGLPENCREYLDAHS